MKTLYIHRHAKSDWDSGAKNDHDRPLNSRGERDAPYMASFCKSENIALDLLLSSTANRAQSTMRFYQKALEFPESKVVLDQHIYHSDVKTMMTVLSELNDDIENVMIFGHNPTFTDLCHHLDGGFRDYLVTCTRVKIDLEIDAWKEIYGDCGIVMEHIYPKKIQERN
jgi:phosphohistidine phosphatase